MKNRSKNRLYLTLMICSILLLLSFQVYWLFQSYQEQKELVQKSVDNIFVESIKELQDSLVYRLIVNPINQAIPDSLQAAELDQRLRRVRRPWQKMPSFYVKADSFTIIPDTAYKAKLEFSFIPKDQPDTSSLGAQRRFFHSMSLAIRGLNQATPTIINFGTDSLRILEIKATVAQRLAAADLDLPFEIVRFQRGDTLAAIPSGFFTSDLPADVPMVTRYMGYFPEYRPLVFSKLMPQFMFAVLLLLITGSSFVLLFRSLMRQQRLTAIKNDFISNVTHELKTPITTVGVALEALNSFNALQDPKRTREYLDISKNELNRLSILVDKVLKMAIFENQELNLQLEPTDIRQLTETVLQSMRLQFEQKGAAISTAFTGSDFTVPADKIHLTSVLYNLLDNALKYSNRNPNISIAVKEGTDGIAMAVEDNGLGIPEIYKDKIFEKFFRVPKGDLHNIKGHGLGLSYVASVIQKHRGSIQVQSEDGKGSIFTVNLPK